MPISCASVQGAKDKTPSLNTSTNYLLVISSDFNHTIPFLSSSQVDSGHSLPQNGKPKSYHPLLLCIDIRRSIATPELIDKGNGKNDIQHELFLAAVTAANLKLGFINAPNKGMHTRPAQ